MTTFLIDAGLWLLVACVAAPFIGHFLRGRVEDVTGPGL